MDRQPHPAALAKLDQMMAEGVSVSIWQQDEPGYLCRGWWHLQVKNHPIRNQEIVVESYPSAVEITARHYGAEW